VSAQPQACTSAVADFYVVVSDGRTPAGAIGPIASRLDAAAVARLLQRGLPRTLTVGITPRRPAKPVIVAPDIEAFRTNLNLASQVMRAASKHEIKPDEGEGDRGRERR
jgi:hypothetical protein